MVPLSSRVPAVTYGASGSESDEVKRDESCDSAGRLVGGGSSNRPTESNEHSYSPFSDIKLFLVIMSENGQTGKFPPARFPA